MIHRILSAIPLPWLLSLAQLAPLAPVDSLPRYNPTFLLPIFAPIETATPSKPSTGRHTGTGSAALSTSLPSPPLLGYLPVPLASVLARTGSLPEEHPTAPRGMYKTLKDARRRERGPVVLFPEGTTGNGRALLKFAEGTLAEGDLGGYDEGIVWIKFFRYVEASECTPNHLATVKPPVTSGSFEEGTSRADVRAVS